MARIELLEPESLDHPALQSVVDRIRENKAEGPDDDGRVPNHFRLESHLPEVLRHVYEARVALWEAGVLPQTLLKKVAVAVSMANGCEYCTGAYCSILSTDMGGDERVHEFQTRLREGELDGLEGDVIDFALSVLEDPHGVSGGDFERLRNEYGLSDAAFLQVVYAVNIVSAYNRVTTVFDASYDHSYPVAWADPDGGA